MHTNKRKKYTNMCNYNKNRIEDEDNLSIFGLLLILFIFFVIMIILHKKNQSMKKKFKKFKKWKCMRDEIGVDRIEKIKSRSNRSLTHLAGADSNNDNNKNININQCLEIPLGDPLNNQLKDILPKVLNEQLTKLGPINYATKIELYNTQMTISLMSTSPLRTTSIIFNPIESNICNNVIKLKAHVIFEFEGLQIQLFALENVGTTSIEGDIQLKLILMVNPANPNEPLSIKIEEMKLQNLNILAMNRPDLNVLFNLMVGPLTIYINNLLQQNLLLSSTGLLKNGNSSDTITLKNNDKMLGDQSSNNNSTRELMQEFLMRQINGMLENKSFLNNFSFNVCKSCPASTLGNIQLGKTVWSSDKGCSIGFDVEPIGCIGCSWAYEVGINSIRGLNNMKLKSLQVSDTIEVAATPLVRYYFSMEVECDGIDIYVTARGQPCTGGLVGLDNDRNRVPGTARILILNAYAEGKYNESTQTVIFNSKDIKIPNSFLSLIVPTDWAKIDTGDSTANAILAPIFDLILLPAIGATNLFQTLVNKIISDTLNSTIKDILQGLIGNLPSIDIMINNVKPVSSCSCLHGGYCAPDKKSCICPDNFSGVYCEKQGELCGRTMCYYPGKCDPRTLICKPF